MKLSSFVTDRGASYGIVDGDYVHDIGQVLGARYPDLKALIAAAAWDVALEAQAQATALTWEELTLLPVIPNPGKILCVGHNYESHRKETGRDKVDHPSIFTRFADSQTAHEDAIVMPSVSTQLDYEGELAIVIGKGGRAIPQAQAMAHIAGYACFNDVSVRDWQWHTRQFTPGKNFPRTGAFGPWLVTADEIADPAALTVTTRLNGDVVQSQPTADMIFPIAEIVAYISAFTPLSPGDVIATGTPGGVGAKRQPPLWMKPGDTVEVDIPGVGLLVNRVQAEA